MNNSGNFSEARHVSVHNLLSYSKFAGVNPNRIFFATRTSKVSHIVRHAAADLFLDSLVYGAHSTATDSLRGVSKLVALKLLFILFSISIQVPSFYYNTMKRLRYVALPK